MLKLGILSYKSGVSHSRMTANIYQSHKKVCNIIGAHFQNTSKNLHPSYKTNLDFLCVLGNIKMEGNKIRVCCFSCSVNNFTEYIFYKYGPVVQIIVSLTGSLRGQLVKCFTTL